MKKFFSDLKRFNNLYEILVVIACNIVLGFIVIYAALGGFTQ
jgi:hypothetical protein